MQAATCEMVRFVETLTCDSPEAELRMRSVSPNHEEYYGADVGSRRYGRLKIGSAAIAITPLTCLLNSHKNINEQCDAISWRHNTSQN